MRWTWTETDRDRIRGEHARVHGKDRQRCACTGRVVSSGHYYVLSVASQCYCCLACAGFGVLCALPTPMVKWGTAILTRSSGPPPQARALATAREQGISLMHYPRHRSARP